MSKIGGDPNMPSACIAVKGDTGCGTFFFFGQVKLHSQELNPFLEICL
jgi:hypothetical protein